jgi:allophanate hydrolase subunit 2
MKMEYAEILSKHSICSIQDRGRATYSTFGIPQGGPMNSELARHVNQLLDNPIDAAVIELFQTEMSLVFSAPTVICLGGFQSEAMINDVKVDFFKPLAIKKGDVLKINYTQHSPWRYIGIKGGWQTASAFGSRSTYLPLGMDRVIVHTKLSYYENSETIISKGLDAKLSRANIGSPIHILPGFDAHMISSDLLRKIFSVSYQISHQSSRHAYINVDAVDIESELPDVISCAVYPGTVQLTPAGKLYIIMKDGQTTGGYLRVGQLTEAELDRVVRIPFGSSFEFEVG